MHRILKVNSLRKINIWDLEFNFLKTDTIELIQLQAITYGYFLLWS